VTGPRGAVEAVMMPLAATVVKKTIKLLLSVVNPMAVQRTLIKGNTFLLCQHDGCHCTGSVAVQVEVIRCRF
jgi:hypothetical protein